MNKNVMLFKRLEGLYEFEEEAYRARAEIQSLKARISSLEADNGKLVEHLRPMVWMSDKWGREWFDKETWTKVHSAKEFLSSYTDKPVKSDNSKP